jgi:hypothetical protein
MKMSANTTIQGYATFIRLTCKYGYILTYGKVCKRFGFESMTSDIGTFDYLPKLARNYK